jgi:hypothetical protein
MGHVSPKKVLVLSDYKYPPTEETDKHFAANNQAFREACAAAGVEPTPRQHSKYRRGRGKARGISKAGRKIDEYGTEVK